MNMKKYAVIVAGGSGKRFGSETPKQFLLIKGLPVLMHTVKRFHDSGCEVKLVLPEAHKYYWSSLCNEYDFSVPHEVIVGGKERFHSVKNGVDSIVENGLVAVHDGVRPLVTSSMINSGFDLAEEKECAIPFVDVRDSMREEKNLKFERVDRSKYKLIQTPQIFRVDRLQELMDCEFDESFTDEATMWEVKGGELFFFEGDHQNLKITYPSDLKFAEAVI